MPGVGIVVEGVKDGYDEKALTVFLQRALGSTTQVIARPCGGKSDLIKKFPNYLEEFRHRGDIATALVVRDADGKCFSELDARMRARTSGRPEYPFPLHLLFIRQELEAWFLADEAALSQVVRRQVPPHHRPENLLSAKEELERILLMGKIQYTSAVAETLARSVNVEALRSRCPSFKRFWELFSSVSP